MTYSVLEVPLNPNQLTVWYYRRIMKDGQRHYQCRTTLYCSRSDKARKIETVRHTCMMKDWWLMKTVIQGMVS